VEQFVVKGPKVYSVFIITDQQGRGLDFPSNSLIEEGGGVFVIVACLPRTSL